MAPTQVVLPSNFSKNCEDSPDCLAADDLLVMTTYFSPASRSVPIVMAVVNNSDHLLAEDPSIKTEVVSGEAERDCVGLQVGERGGGGPAVPKQWHFLSNQLGV
jgi:hypothetical protein